MGERERLFFDSSNPDEDLVIKYFEEWHKEYGKKQHSVTQRHYEYLYDLYWREPEIYQSRKPKVACRAAAFWYIRTYVLETSGMDCPACLKDRKKKPPNSDRR